MIANVRGIEIHYSQQNGFWQLVSRNEWEPFTFDCIDKYCLPGSVFIDIGAWNGVFSVYANKKGCLAYAIEPDNEAAKMCKTLIDNNGLFIPVIQMAISNEFGETYLMNNNWGNSESSLIVREGIKGSKKVEATTLPKFFNCHPETIPTISLIKMDIEGAEIAVLTQAREWITEHKPNMHISFHPAYIESYDGVMYLFDVYDCVSDNGTAVNADNFQAVLDAHSHAFCFTTK